MQSVLNTYQNSTFSGSLTFGKSDLNARRNFLDEIKGEGNSVNFKFRMHDPRLGRFFAVDPLAPKYPHNGPYNFSENRVINAIELEGLETFDVYVTPTITDPKLKHVNVLKSSNDVQPTPTGLQVTYHYMDNSGKETGTEVMDDFKEGSSERYAMNMPYEQDGKVLGTRITAMNISKIVPGKLVPVSIITGESRLFSQNAFQYDVNVLFETDKSNISKTDLAAGTYPSTMKDINNLADLMNNPIEYVTHGQKTTLDLKVRDIVVNGETDSRPSNYGGSAGAGNYALGQDRGCSLKKQLEAKVPGISCNVQVVNHSGEVKDSDRNASVLFVPRH